MLREELKKIWRPGVLLALVILGAVFYLMFLEFYTKHFPNGPNDAAQIELAADLIDQYGTTLEPEAYEKLTATLPVLMAEADQHIRANSLAQRNGLSSYAEYVEFQEETRQYSGELSKAEQEKYTDAMLIQNALWGGETDNIYGRLYAVETTLREYDAWRETAPDLQSRVYDMGYGQKAYENAARRFFGTDNAWRNILPNQVPEAVGNYMGMLLIWISLSVCVLLSPVLVRDRMCNLRPLQWSARRGRGVFQSQLAAAMLSAFLWTTLNLLIFGGLFLTNGISAFFSSRMFSFLMSGFSWVNWSFGVWCLVLIGLCYLICFGAAGLAFFLSRYSGNYVAMLLKLIPLLTVCAILAPKLLIGAFYYQNQLYLLTSVPMIELIAAVVVFVLGLGLCCFAAARMKRQDLLSS